MNVRSICLAILYCSDRTGYDIRKFSTEGNFSFFIDASYGSIYPALNKLETEQLVTCHHVAEEGKPTRKVYSITESGRKALFEELLQPHRPDIYKSEFLLISLFARLIGPDAIKEAIDRQVQQLNEELALISSCSESELQTDLESDDCGRNKLDLQAAEWTKTYGRYCVQVSIDYLKMHGEALVEIARQGNTTEPQAQTGLSE